MSFHSTWMRQKQPSQRPALPLGQQLLQAGYLDQLTIAQILAEQSQSPLRFGEISQDLGSLSPEALYRFVECSSLRLGEILVLNGFLSFAQLKTSLQQQQKSLKKLGDLLVTNRMISSEILEWALHEQSYLQTFNRSRAWSVLQKRLTETATQRQCLQQQWQSGLQASSAFDHFPPLPQASGEDLLTTSCRELPWITSNVLEPEQGTDWLDHCEGHLKIAPVTVDKAEMLNLMNQIESLQMQLYQQEEEFQRYSRQVQDQLWEYQQQYQERVDFLEAELHKSQALTHEQNHQITEYELRINELEAKLWRQNERLQGHRQGEVEVLQQQVSDLETELKAAQRVEQKYEGMLLKLQEQVFQQEVEAERLREHLLQAETARQGNVVQLRKEPSSPLDLKDRLSPSANYHLQQILRQNPNVLIPISLLNVREHLDIGQILLSLYANEAEVDSQIQRLEGLLQVHRKESRQNSGVSKKLEFQIFRLLGLQTGFPLDAVEQT
ncbi:MAG: hypothetical protein HC921_09840 [Synechococcaceae cyanobacterium SM2_3_1]|nr:hypothetical protein [Synechococcaceae cyanobacterium SM2_3_1]